MTEITLAPVGRQVRCDECRKLLPNPVAQQTQITCDRCDSVKRLPTKLESDSSGQPMFGSTEVPAQPPASPPPDAQREEIIQDKFAAKLDVDPGHADQSDELEIRLMPTLARMGSEENAEIDPAIESELLGEHGDVSLGVVAKDGRPLIKEERGEQARSLYNQSAGLYPKERHYPTLEAMQRLTRLFGYVVMATVFPYLLFRLAKSCYAADGNLLGAISEFTEFSVPIIFQTVGAIGLLFISSEGIKLAIDLQDNTLRIANRGGRRKD